MYIWCDPFFCIFEWCGLFLSANWFVFYFWFYFSIRIGILLLSFHLYQWTICLHIVQWINKCAQGKLPVFEFSALLLTVNSRTDHKCNPFYRHIFYVQMLLLYYIHFITSSVISFRLPLCFLFFFRFNGYYSWNVFVLLIHQQFIE